MKRVNFIFETFLLFVISWSFGDNATGQECPQQGHLLRNVGSGSCIGAQQPFGFGEDVRTSDCPSSGNLFYRFAINDSSTGQLLALAYYSGSDGTYTSDKCLYTGVGDGDYIRTDTCDTGNPWHGWDFKDAATGGFFISHRVTGKCAQASQTDDFVYTHTNCDESDPYMRWNLG